MLIQETASSSSSSSISSSSSSSSSSISSSRMIPMHVGRICGVPSRVSVLTARDALVSVENKLGGLAVRNACELIAAKNMHGEEDGVVLTGAPPDVVACNEYRDLLVQLLDDIEECAAYMLIMVAMSPTPGDLFDKSKVWTGRHAQSKVRTYNRVLSNIEAIVPKFTSEKAKPGWSMQTLMARDIVYYGSKGGPSAVCAQKMVQKVLRHACYLPDSKKNGTVRIVLASLLADIASGNQNGVPMKDTTTLVYASTLTAVWAHKNKKSATCVSFFLDPYRCLRLGLAQNMNLRTFIEPVVYTARVLGAGRSVFAKIAVSKKEVNAYVDKDFLSTALCTWVGRSSKPIKKFVEHLLAMGWIKSASVDKYYRLLNQDYYYCSACKNNEATKGKAKGKAKSKAIPQWKTCSKTPECAQASRKLPKVKSCGPIFCPRWPMMERITGVRVRTNLKGRFGIITCWRTMLDTGIMPRQWVETLQLVFTKYGNCEDLYNDLRTKPRKMLRISKFRCAMIPELRKLDPTWDSNVEVVGGLSQFSSIGVGEYASITPEAINALKEGFDVFNQEATRIMQIFDTLFGTGLSESICNCYPDDMDYILLGKRCGVTSAEEPSSKKLKVSPAYDV